MNQIVFLFLILILAIGLPLFFKINESKLKDDKKLTYKIFLKMKKYILKNNEKISIYFDDENNVCIYKEIKERDEDYLDYYYFESSMNGYLHSFGDSPSKQEIRDDYAFCFCHVSSFCRHIDCNFSHTSFDNNYF